MSMSMSMNLSLNLRHHTRLKSTKATFNQQLWTDPSLNRSRPSTIPTTPSLLKVKVAGSAPGLLILMTCLNRESRASPSGLDPVLLKILRIE